MQLFVLDRTHWPEKDDSGEKHDHIEVICIRLSQDDRFFWPCESEVECMVGFMCKVMHNLGETI